MVSVAVWPAVNVAGVATPLPVNPVPLTLTLVRLRLALPEFVMVRVCVPVLPSFTFPNEMLLELTEIPGAVATPVPVIETLDGEFGALLMSETLPGKLPAVVGANVTLKLAELPAEIVAGVDIPLMV